VTLATASCSSRYRPRLSLIVARPVSGPVAISTRTPAVRAPFSVRRSLTSPDSVCLAVRNKKKTCVNGPLTMLLADTVTVTSDVANPSLDARTRNVPHATPAMEYSSPDRSVRLDLPASGPSSTCTRAESIARPGHGGASRAIPVSVTRLRSITRSRVVSAAMITSDVRAL